MKHAAFLKNVAVISAGGLLAKGIGALYRFPLLSNLGGYGMGLYQMTYPFFCLLLTFSSAGIPSAFSRMIAETVTRGRAGESLLHTALRLFALFGLCGTAFMCLFAPVMSTLQKDGNLMPCYLALAPSVAIVALISVFRGYFQGNNDMVPTATSELIEQLVKVTVGMAVLIRFRGSVNAVVYALGAVSVSEAAAFLWLFMRYRAERLYMPPSFLPVHRTTGIEVFTAVLPAMAAAMLLPLSQTVDSVLIVRLLPCESDRAVTLYGLLTGGAVSLINLPATLAYGLVAATVPAVSVRFTRGEVEEGLKRSLYSLMFTMILSVPCALGLYFFARPAVSLLYSSLPYEDADTLVELIKISAMSAVTLAGTNTLTACLTGMGKAKKAALSMGIAITVKAFAQILLVPSFSIQGAAIASNLCYLVAFSLDLVYTVKKPKRGSYDYNRQSGSAERRPDRAGAYRLETGEKGFGKKFVARLRRAERRGH